MQTTVESPTALAWMLGHFAIVGGAALVSGVVVGGLGGRLFMRVAAIIAPDQATGRTTDAGFIVGEITIGTVFFVIFIGLAAGLVGSVVYVVCEPWLAWAGRARGALMGAVLLAVAARPSDALGTDNRDFVILGEPLPLVLMIIGLFVAYGVVLVALVDRIERRWGEPLAQLGIAPSAAFVSVGAPVALLASGSLFFVADACGCDVPVAASWLLVGLGGFTAAWWVSQLVGRRVRAVVVGGHALFAVTVLVGARQTVDDIRSLL